MGKNAKKDLNVYLNCGQNVPYQPFGRDKKNHTCLDSCQFFDCQY